MKSAAIDKNELEALKLVYKPGTLVEVVSVAGLEPGTLGQVRDVKRNGNISIAIEGKNVTVDVIYQKELVKIVHKNLGCLLGKTRGTGEGQCKDNCKICGWDKAVDERRKKDIRDGKMIDNGNGLKVLIVKSRVETA